MLGDRYELGVQVKLIIIIIIISSIIIIIILITIVINIISFTIITIIIFPGMDFAPAGSLPGGMILLLSARQALP